MFVCISKVQLNRDAYVHDRSHLRVTGVICPAAPVGPGFPAKTLAFRPGDTLVCRPALRRRQDERQFETTFDCYPARHLWKRAALAESRALLEPRRRQFRM